MAGALAVGRFDPGRYGEIPVLELLRAASRGWIGVDRRLVKSILDRGEAGMADVLAFSRESLSSAAWQEHRVDLDPLLIDLFHYSPHPEAVDFFMDAIRRQPRTSTTF